jgi:hypothetical protein
MPASSSQPPDLGQCLARLGFTPNPGNPAWLDLSTGQQTVRVLHEPGEATLLYCLAPRSACLYEAVFSPGTPDAVITAAIEAALSPPPPPAGRELAKPASGQRRTLEGKK